MKLKSGHWIFVVAVLLAAFSLSKGIDYYTSSLAALPVYGPIQNIDGVEKVHTIPAFTLIAEDGGMFNSGILDGKVSVVNFFFVSCPSVCPRMMRNLQAVHELYRNDPAAMIISMTVDPERDTPQRLAKYAEKLNANTQTWRFLSGEKGVIYGLARNAYFLSASEGDGGPYDFIHSENLVLVDATGQIRGYYNGLDEKSIRQLQKDIAKLKRKNP